MPCAQAAEASTLTAEKPVSTTDENTAPSTAESAVTSSQDEEHTLSDQVWQTINRYFYDGQFHGVNWQNERDLLANTQLPNRDITYKLLRTSITKLNDRYTRLLTPQDMRGLRKYDVSGVGLMLTQNEQNQLVVSSEPLRDTAAGRAGVKRGDVVLAIDGKSIEGVDAFTVSEWMQGKEGSMMRVTLRDMGELSLERRFENKSVNSVKSVGIVHENDDMGYIHLSDFTASSRNDVAAALRELRNAGAKWLVLDLRGNGGGVFEGALEIGGLLQGDSVPMVQVFGRQNSLSTDNLSYDNASEAFKTKLIDSSKDDAWIGIDIAVLLNPYSASSSEVLAAGLHDNCSAAVVGDRSFGKGLIQGLFGLSDGGGLVVTIAEYRTPNGTAINGVGIIPDFALHYRGVDQILKVIGVERMEKGAFVLTHEHVQETLRMCREHTSSPAQHPI